MHQSYSGNRESPESGNITFVVIIVGFTLLLCSGLLTMFVATTLWNNP